MNRTTRWGAIAVVSLLLTGCGSTTTDPESESAQEKSSTGSHTLPDFSISSSDITEPSGIVQPASAEPSPAARMVCDGDVSADVERILGLDGEPTRNASWAEPMYTCTYSLDEGPLVLSVHDATDAKSGRDHFETLRTTFDDTSDLAGMYGLGLPAYETDDGTVVFIKDNKTLQVDATQLPDGLGPDDDLDRTGVAYAVATSVLACWEKHA